MNWIPSIPVRLGLGPPEWIVIMIILGALAVASLEAGESVPTSRGPWLKPKEKWVALSLGALVVALVCLAAWRRLAG